MICDLGASVEFNATAKVYPPTNSSIIPTVLGDGANFGVEHEHFSGDDMTWWPIVTMLTCHEKRGDTRYL
jgi:hypothetical protein